MLDEGPTHKVKRIVVRSGKRLSYQRHVRRSEHWFVVEGRGVVTLDGDRIDVRPGSTVDVSTGVAHRVANSGTVNLVLSKSSMATTSERTTSCGSRTTSVGSPCDDGRQPRVDHTRVGSCP